MRTIGIIVVFFLGVAAIVEAGFLVKTSRDVQQLSQELKLLQGQESGGPTLSGFVPSAQTGASLRPAAPNRPSSSAALPGFHSPPSSSTSPATASLGQALATAEGRQHLQAAMHVLKEEKQQTKQVERLPKIDERSAAYKERLFKTITLSSDEQNKVSTLLSTLGTQSRHVVEQMKSGVISAGQAHDQMDELRDKTQESIHAALGEERVKQFRAAEKAAKGNKGRGNNAP